MTWQAGALRFVESPLPLRAVFAVITLLTLAFTLGFGTKFVKWLMFPALVTIDARLPELFTGGDGVLHIATLYAPLLPLGESWSIDSWARGRKFPSFRPPTAIVTFAYPLILLQLAVIYFFNMRAKAGAAWHNGEAVAMALGSSTLATQLGAWVLSLPTPLLHALTYGTLAIEGSLPLLLLSPWARRFVHALACLLMLALHGGIFLAMEVGSFSAALMSFVPLLWHPRDEQQRVRAHSPRRVWFEAAAVSLLLYVGAGRLSRDLLLFPNRPQLPVPSTLDNVTRALGLLQGWMMFSPEPPDRDYVVVTDAVTRKGLHFDPFREVASGNTKVLKEMPRSVVREHIFTRYENFLSEKPYSQIHPYFSRWVLSQRGPDGEPVERFDAWLLAIMTIPNLVVPPAELARRVGVLTLPLEPGHVIKSFEAVGVWAPERAFDRKIMPEGTHVLTPFSASMSAGCPHLTLDFGAPEKFSTAYFQAGSSDSFLIESSLDGASFSSLGEMKRVQGSQQTSRVVELTGAEARFVRIRPSRPQGMSNFISEVAFYDHPVGLPEVPKLDKQQLAFLSSLERPSIAGIVSATSHPSAGCPAEDPTEQEKLRRELANP